MSCSYFLSEFSHSFVPWSSPAIIIILIANSATWKLCSPTIHPSNPNVVVDSIPFPLPMLTNATTHTPWILSGFKDKRSQISIAIAPQASPTHSSGHCVLPLSQPTDAFALENVDYKWRICKAFHPAKPHDFVISQSWVLLLEQLIISSVSGACCIYIMIMSVAGCIHSH